MTDAILPPRPDVTGKRVRDLQCCCCGGRTRDRQFWNQDTGHGLGDCCDACVSSRMSPDEVRSAYGVRGVHFSLTKGTLS
jgi:hypothetical protein